MDEWRCNFFLFAFFPKILIFNFRKKKNKINKKKSHPIQHHKKSSNPNEKTKRIENHILEQLKKFAYFIFIVFFILSLFVLSFLMKNVNICSFSWKIFFFFCYSRLTNHIFNPQVQWKKRDIHTHRLCECVYFHICGFDIFYSHKCVLFVIRENMHKME